MLILREIALVWKYRELLWQLTSREIKARYKQSVLGYFWVIFNPLSQMLVMSFAFSVVLRIPTYTSEHIPYSIFLFTALLPWNLFSNSLASAASSLVNNSSLVTKIYFPRSVLPISTILAKLVDFAFASLILIVYLVSYQIPISLNILWIFPIFIIQQIFTAGLSLFFAAANLIYRDIQYLLTLILSLWMYVTPVLYPTNLVPDNLKFIFQLNPMSVIINAYRQAILTSQAPNMSSMLIALFLSLITIYFGLSFFKQNEKTFADNV